MIAAFEPARNPRVLILEPERFAAGAAARIAAALRAAIEQTGTATWALSGGGTPRPVYARLAAHESLDWRKVQVFFADERCVAPDHADSSYRMVAESLLAPLGDSAPRVHRMEGEDDDPAAAAARYQALLPERLDLVLLGMGPDGHTASLFPSRPDIWSDPRPVFEVLDSPKPPPRRLTLGPAMIRQATELIVLARGGDKAGVLASALAPLGDAIELPARLARRGLWICDPDAAVELDPASLEPHPPEGLA